MPAALGLFVVFAAPASAQVTQAGIFKNLGYAQTDANTVSPAGVFFNAQVFFTSLGDYTSATLTDPGPGSPENLPQDTPLSFGNSPGFPNQAAMDAAYPFGTYTIALAAGSQPATSVSFDYLVDAYTADIPKLAATSFNSLLGLSTALSSLTLNFNSFTPSPFATTEFTFFSIFNSTQGCGFLGSSTTSCTIDPQALMPGTTYTWELDFSDAVESTNDDNVLTYTDFDVRTDGSFTTAALATPEVSTWAMALIGFAGLGAAAFRRSRTTRLAA